MEKQRVSTSRCVATTVVCALVVIAAFVLGVSTFQLGPHGAARWLKSRIGFKQVAAPLGGSRDLFESAFTLPINPGQQLLPPIRSLPGITEANASLLVPVNTFWTAYRDLELVAHRTLVLDGGTTRVLDVQYRLSGRLYHAYAYILSELRAADAAVLVIPQSGDDRASALLHDNDHRNLRSGIDHAFPGWDQYVLIN